MSHTAYVLSYRLAMPVDYDLVIIGGSAAARHAARFARQFHARIALIEPPPPQIGSLDTQRSVCRALQQFGQRFRQLYSVTLEAQNEPSLWATHGEILKTGLADDLAWSTLTTHVQSRQTSLSMLTASGIDTIVGAGEFRRRPTVAFQVGGRELRSRAYLLAGGSQLIIPTVSGIDTLSPLTIDDCLHPETITRLIHRHLVLVGSTSYAIMLAQSLVRLGVRVTLIVQDRKLLPDIDDDLAWGMQIHLEADGIQMVAGVTVIQVRELDGQTWVQVGNQAIAADEVLFLDERQPCLETLNLAAATVKYEPQGIRVNHHLQTQNPRIYAIGEAIGHYEFANVTQYEAEIAVKNALFLPTRSILDQWVPKVIEMAPPAAWVGMTEADAKTRYGRDIHVFRESMKVVPKAQRSGDTTGFCKLVLLSSGELLGAHLIGYRADEVIGILAVAMQNNMTIEAIAQLVYPTDAMADMINQIAAQWRQRRLSRGWRRNLFESLFTLRRDWS
ncbi:MAG: FAD-dependent oxidoreductase [Elainellaceae cyanobacterium]